MILVTGATGLIGCYLLFELSKNPNRHIKALYRDEKKILKVKQFFADSENGILLFSKITWIKGNILDIQDLKSALDHVEEVYHIAGLVSFDNSDQKLLRQSNIIGVQNMVNVSLDKGVKKFCYVSSIATNDNQCQIEDKDSQYFFWKNDNKISYYAYSKYQGELEVMRGIQEGLNAFIVNPAIVLGKGFWDNSSGKLFKTLYAYNYGYYVDGGSGFIDAVDLAKIMIKLMKKKLNQTSFVLVAENLYFLDIQNFISKHLVLKKPSKRCPKWFLKAIIISKPVLKILGIKIGLNRQILESLYSVSKYQNEVDHEFIKISDSIENICNAFTKDHNKI